MEPEDHQKGPMNEKEKSVTKDEDKRMARIFLLAIGAAVIVLVIVFVFVFGKISVGPTGY